MKPVFSFCLFLIFTNQLTAQKQGQDRIDSLIIALPNMKEDSDKVKMTNTVSSDYRLIDANKGLVWGAKGLALALKLKLRKGEAAAYNCIGSNYWVLHDYLAEQTCYLKALEINEAIHDQKGTARSLRNIGSIFEVGRNYPQAIKYYQKELAIGLELKDNEIILRSLTDISYVFLAQKDYSKAMASFKDLIAKCLKLNRIRDIAGYSRKIGLVESELGNYITALEYENRALQTYESLENDNPYKKEDIAWNMRDLALVYFEQGNYVQSLIYCKRSFYLFMDLPGRFAKDNAGICLEKIGKAYLKMAFGNNDHGSVYRTQLKDAAAALTKAVELLKPNDWATLVETLSDLTDVQHLLGNYFAEAEASKQYSIYKDSLYNTEKYKEIITRQMEYEFDKQKDSINTVNKLAAASSKSLLQENELATLRMKQRLFVFIGIFTILCGVAFYVQNRNRLINLKLQNELSSERLKQQLKEANYQSQINDISFTVLRSQMNPHFIFNCLNSIKLYTEQNNNEAASDYLSKFAQLIRNTLDNARMHKVMLTEEITSLELYLQLEAMRFKEKLVYHIDVDRNVDIDFIEIPPMMVQPYVENAIWHGLMHKKEGGSLRIHFSQVVEDSILVITITDNGIGRKKAAGLKRETTEKHKSYGTKITEERIALINEKYKAGAEVNIEDLCNERAEATGTLVTIKLPIK